MYSIMQSLTSGGSDGYILSRHLILTHWFIFNSCQHTSRKEMSACGWRYCQYIIHILNGSIQQLAAFKLIKIVIICPVSQWVGSTCIVYGLSTKTEWKNISPELSKLLFISSRHGLISNNLLYGKAESNGQWHPFDSMWCLKGLMF